MTATSAVKGSLRRRTKALSASACRARSCHCGQCRKTENAVNRDGNNMAANKIKKFLMGHRRVGEMAPKSGRRLRTAVVLPRLNETGGEKLRGSLKFGGLGPHPKPPLPATCWKGWLIRHSVRASISWLRIFRQPGRYCSPHGTCLRKMQLWGWPHTARKRGGSLTTTCADGHQCTGEEVTRSGDIV